jgi:hypothetical protein
VKLVPHILDQVRLKVQKHQSQTQMRLLLKNAYETSWYLVIDSWSNNGSDSVIVHIVVTVLLILDNYVVQDNAGTHDQLKSASKTDRVWLVC